MSTQPAGHEAVLSVLEQHATAAFGPESSACRCDRTWRKHAEHRRHVLAALSDAGFLATEQEAVSTAGVPLRWVDDRTGYQCPSCALYVCVPPARWATCPRCASVPIDEVATIALANDGFDETDTGNVVDALRPLLDALSKAAAS